MFVLMVVVFVLGYVAIALEHPLKVDKAATPTVLFFLGILTAVSALQSAGHLHLLATNLDSIELSDVNKYTLLI